jgi:hypothetical protein
MLALTATPHADPHFLERTFHDVARELGYPALDRSVIDLSEPPPWDLYARPLSEILAIVSPTSFMQTLED